MSLSLPGLQSQALPAGPTAETGVCSSGRHWPSSKGLDPSPPPPCSPSPAFTIRNWEQQTEGSRKRGFEHTATYATNPKIREVEVTQLPFLFFV